MPLAAFAIPPDIERQRYCASLAAIGNCNFYYQCLEQWTRSCGNSGYALGYGGKYCRRFYDTSYLFTSAVGY